MYWVSCVILAFVPVTLASRMRFQTLGATKVSSSPMMATTTMISMSVKPEGAVLEAGRGRRMQVDMGLPSGAAELEHGQHDGQDDEADDDRHEDDHQRLDDGGHALGGDL